MTKAEIDAYRILDNMQAARYFWTLRETNGGRCGNKQMRALRNLNFPGYAIEIARTQRQRARKNAREKAQ